jgi:hypothetical protein
VGNKSGWRRSILGGRQLVRAYHWEGFLYAVGSSKRWRHPNPHFSCSHEKCAQVPTFVGVNRESFRPGRLLPKRPAPGGLFTNLEICEKSRLIGVITLTGRSGNLFNYNCQFQGLGGTNLPVLNIDELLWGWRSWRAWSRQCGRWTDRDFRAG